jgi:spermidine/putrescine transport system permease protein
VTDGAAAVAAGPEHDAERQARRRARRRRLTPYLLIAPAMLWLLLFYALPALEIIRTAFASGDIISGVQRPPGTWTLENFEAAFTDSLPFIGNSLRFGGVAALLSFLIGYPVAHTIAFRGGAFKPLLLFLVIAPFFTSFLIRVIAWRVVLGDDGPLLGVLRSLGLASEATVILNTPLAVLAGLTYQSLPFMILALYATLERLDLRLLEAARDLYSRRVGARGIGPGALLGLGVGLAVAWGVAASGSWLVALAALGAVGGAASGFFISTAFLHVTLPLSLPGIFAGSVITFIPAFGDYVNAEILGNPSTNMLGNVIVSRLLEQNDLPGAAAMSCILVALVAVAVFAYARILGTEDTTALEA